MELTRYDEMNSSSVRVNPLDGGSLAQAFFQGNALHSFEYRGHDADELAQLRRLASELNGAVIVVLHGVADEEEK